MRVKGILIEIVLIFLCCHAQSRGQIVLINETKGPVYLQVIDRFDDSQLSILSQSNKKAVLQSINQPIFIRNAQRAFYLLMPRASYTITSGPNQYLVLKTASDSLSKITNFHQAYKLASQPLQEQTWEFIAEYLAGSAYAKLTFTQRADTLRRRYQSRLDFLESYARLHQIDPGQLTPWKDFFFYQYLQGLLYHRPGQIPSDSLTRYVTYFQNDRNLNMPMYRQAAASLVRVMVQQKRGKLDFAQMYQQANRLFSAGTRDYLLFHILKTLTQRKQGKLDNLEFDPILAQQLLPLFKTDCQTIEYIRYITQTMQLLKMARRSGGDTVLLLDSSGRFYTWTDLLATNRGKVIYIDFWASWCTPCRAELPASHRLRMSLSMAKINFVYISMDEDAKAWDHAVKAVALERAASYLLVNSFRSALARRYQLKAIPRYLLFDQQGQLISGNAKRPSNKAILAELQRLSH